MKKVWCFMLAFGMMFAMFSFGHQVAVASSIVKGDWGENVVSVFVNSKEVFFDSPQPPYVKDGYTLVPFRGIFEALGAMLLWDEGTKTITGQLNNRRITLRLNEKTAMVNGEKVRLGVPAFSKYGRVFVPLRFISEGLGCQVFWNAKERAVHIFSLQGVNVTYIPTILNVDTNDYRYGNYFEVANRYMFADQGKIHILESYDGKLYIHHFDPMFRSHQQTVIPMNLPIFGGFHASDDGYYYVVYGANNNNESNSKDVFSIVKYNKEWKEVGKLRIRDVYVTQPFHASNLEMDSRNGILAIHTARLRYTSEDGKRHQSNISFLVDTKTMTLLPKDSYQWPNNHVSHSFATFVRFDGDRVVYVDHGDAYPRSIVLQTEEDGMITNVIDILRFPKVEEECINYTGAKLGGFEVATNNYLVVGSSVYPKNPYRLSEVKNLFIATVSKDAEDDTAVKINWLTNFSVSSGKSVEEVHIRKISDDRFLLVWSVDDDDGFSSTFYAVVDGEGRLVKDPRRVGIPTPGNMHPLVIENDVYWYSSSYVGTFIYKLHLE
ncbi:copper amine oxidase N-terminal domain-containing protein [Anoxybacillus sp. TBDG-1]